MTRKSFNVTKNTLNLSINYENLEFHELLDDHIHYKIIVVRDKMTKNFYIMKTIEPKNKYPEEKIVKEIEILEKIHSNPNLPLIFLNFYGFFKSENLISRYAEYSLVFEHFHSSSIGKILSSGQKMEISEIIDLFKKIIHGCVYLQSINIFLPLFNADMFYMKKNLDNEIIEYKFTISTSQEYEQSSEIANYKSSVQNLGIFFKKLICNSLQKEGEEEEKNDEKLISINLMELNDRFLENESKIIQDILIMLDQNEESRPDFFYLFKHNLDLKKNILSYIQIEEGMLNNIASLYISNKKVIYKS